jgi:hypothetical protein
MRDAKACNVSLMKHGRADRNKEKKRQIDAHSGEADSGGLCRQLGMNKEADNGNKSSERYKERRHNVLTCEIEI